MNVPASGTAAFTTNTTMATETLEPPPPPSTLPRLDPEPVRAELQSLLQRIQADKRKLEKELSLEDNKVSRLWKVFRKGSLKEKVNYLVELQRITALASAMIETRGVHSVNNYLVDFRVDLYKHGYAEYVERLNGYLEGQLLEIIPPDSERA